MVVVVVVERNDRNKKKTGVGERLHLIPCWFCKIYIVISLWSIFFILSLSISFSRMMMKLFRASLYTCLPLESRINSQYHNRNIF